MKSMDIYHQYADECLEDVGKIMQRLSNEYTTYYRDFKLVRVEGPEFIRHVRAYVVYWWQKGNTPAEYYKAYTYWPLNGGEWDEICGLARTPEAACKDAVDECYEIHGE